MNQAEIQRLRERIHFLEQENDSLKEELNYYKQKEEKLQKKLEQQTLENNALEDLFIRNSSEYYQLKDSLLNRNEGIYYSNIRKELFSSDYADAYSSKYKKLYVFPQVTLHSVIQLTRRGAQYDMGDNSFFARKYLSKSIDFLICSLNIQSSDIQKTYNYQPLLAIEIDGSYHNDQDQIERDKIKNMVLESIGLPLIRYDLTNKSRENIETVIRKTLLDK